MAKQNFQHYHVTHLSHMQIFCIIINVTSCFTLYLERK